MAIPGFTAEASLYQTSGQYRLVALLNGNVGIHAVPAAQRRITPFGGGGNGRSRQCLPDTTGDCPQTGFEIFLCDINDCTPTGDCCTPPPPPPPPPPSPTEDQCLHNWGDCLLACAGIPFPFTAVCFHFCDTALCDCLHTPGTLPPGTVVNCGI